MKQDLNQSRLYYFIDSQNGIAFNFLEGQRIVHDLVLLQKLNGSAFAFNRNVVLSLLPLNAFLKPSEAMGLFIDSERPYFRFKLETNYTGTFRTMLLPEEFSDLPSNIHGKCRITKILPKTVEPYLSIIDLNGENEVDMINKILQQSYQVKAKVLLSESSDQSILINVLPRQEYDKKDGTKATSLSEILLERQKQLLKVMDKGLMEEQQIIKAFEDIGLNYLSSKEIKFFCPCSKQQMVGNLQRLPQNDVKQIFKEDGNIHISCDYCKQEYTILPEDVLKSSVH